MRVPLKEKAYQYILEQIMQGELPYNKPLVESDYCMELNMSRTPIREALKKLEAEGLVYSIAERGVFVKEITVTDIDEICQLRKLFELEALKFAIQRVTAEEIQECRKLLLELNKNSSTVLYFKADRSFHRIIMKYCPNRRLQVFYKNIQNQIERFQRVLATRKDNYIYAQQQHLELLDALETREYDVAAAALEKHLNTIHDSIIEVYNHNRLTTF
ncbi:MAG: GntR family transcriptional regulator [Eubacteriales bacterium]|nr:GntR family transcriptional regulator [Eubacteriales bacterium]